MNEFVERRSTWLTEEPDLRRPVRRVRNWWDGGGKGPTSSDKPGMWATSL